MTVRGGLIPWRIEFGPKDCRYRAWKWRGLLVTPARRVKTAA